MSEEEKSLAEQVDTYLIRLVDAFERETSRALAVAEEQGYRLGYDAAVESRQEEIENLEMQNAILRAQNTRQDAALEDLHHTLARVFDYPR